MEDFEENTIENDEAPIVSTGFAAVPIHFRPGKQIEKKVKLVIPGIEPPLLFLTVSGETAEDISVEIHTQEDIDSGATEPTGDIVKTEDDAVIANEAETVPLAESQPMDLEDIEDAEKIEEEGAAIDRIVEDAPPLKEANEPQEAEDESVFLIAIDPEVDPQVIEIIPEEDESIDEAITRMSSENPGYRVGTLEDTKKLADKKPSTDEDN